MQVYEEIAEFIASRIPREILEFRPSEEARKRVWELIERQKTEPLSEAEQIDLGRFMEVEHWMRLAKARARQLLALEQG